MPTTRVMIAVGLDDIRHGKPRTSTSDPICLATRRTLPRLRLIGVGASSLQFEDGDSVCMVKLPPEALAFVAKFDAGEPVVPFAFAVDMPGRLMTLGGPAAGGGTCT